MSRIIVRALLLIAFMAMSSPLFAQPRDAYAAVNGTQIYYEVRGNGPPLVMLHGGVTPSETFGAPRDAMAKNFNVIAIHARGHGLSKDTAGPWSIEQDADDVAAVLKHLKIGKASVMGYSFGGAIALQFAIRHPDMLDRLVIISADYTRKGEYPEIRTAFEQMSATADTIGSQIAQSPLAQMYPGVDWPTLMHKTADLNKKDYDWSAGIRGIKAQTLLIFADADAIRPEHMAEFYKLLGGGQRDAGLDGSLRSPNQLAVIPGTTHYNVIASPFLAQYATAFLMH
jgi:pimeloyl-ACP methyl ester carboxylesterase